MKIYSVEYPGRVGPPTAQYPGGEPIDLVTPGTGTPLQAGWVADGWGFFYALLAEAGLAPDGTPEGVGTGQLVGALKTVVKGQVPTLTDLVFANVATMKTGVTNGGQPIDFASLASINARVTTTAYYEPTAVNVRRYGGADYIIMTAAEYGATPDGYADHYVGGGTSYVAMLVLGDAKPKASQHGFLPNGMPAGNADAWDAMIARPYNAFEFDVEGTYWFERQIVGKTQFLITSPWRQEQARTNVIFRSDTASIGDGVALYKMAPGTTQIQSCGVENITFYGDTPVDFADLSTIPDSGFIAIDPSGVKEGLVITGCVSRNVRGTIWPISGHGFIGHTDCTNNSFKFNREVFKDFDTTTGVDLSGTKCYDNFTLGDISRPYGKNITFNNSTYSDENACLKFLCGDFENLYIEGYNRTLQPSKYLRVDGASYLSESFSLGGTTKFSIKPQGDNVLIEMVGTRIATNTRLIDFSSVTDTSSIEVKLKANYNGSSFGNTSDINFYIQQGLSVDGSSNDQLAWNINATNAPTYFGKDRSAGDGLTERFPHLDKKVNFANSISFTLSFPAELHNEPSFNQSYSLAEFDLVGANNGAGGNEVYFANVKIYNGFGAVWGVYKSGTDEALYTVTLSNEAANSVDVVISETHAGADDILILKSATANCKIQFT